MKHLGFNLMILLFIGCGGGVGSDSTPVTIAIAQEEVSVEETTSIGSVLKKITIPLASEDEVVTVVLTGEGSENFQVNLSGEISLKKSLLTNKVQKVLEKTIKKEEYNLQLLVKYKIKDDYKLNVLIIILTTVDDEPTETPTTSTSTPGTETPTTNTPTTETPTISTPETETPTTETPTTNTPAIETPTTETPTTNTPAIETPTTETPTTISTPAIETPTTETPTTNTPETETPTTETPTTNTPETETPTTNTPTTETPTTNTPETETPTTETPTTNTPETETPTTNTPTTETPTTSTPETETTETPTTTSTPETETPTTNTPTTETPTTSTPETETPTTETPTTSTPETETPTTNTPTTETPTTETPTTETPTTSTPETETPTTETPTTETPTTNTPTTEAPITNTSETETTETPPDTSIPILSLVGATNITIIQSTTYVDAGATANDARDGNISSNIVTNNSVNTAILGTYSITYDVNDSAGNSATQIIRTVNVVLAPDTSIPILSLVGATNITIIQSTTYVDAGATANDARDGNISSNIVTNNSVNTAILGTYSITYDVNDSAGNSATQIIRTVNVVLAPNTVPTIAGVAKTSTNVYTIYQFLPIANDSDENILTFTISNKPIWADFNVSTGLLSGVTMSEGNYSNIVVSVSDGRDSVSLAPFSIEVLPAIDIAHKFGNATQGTDGSYYYYDPASNAIDNNYSTYNHTRGGKNGKNWLQIELPSPTKVSKIVLQNRSHASRIRNAKVYLSNTPYTGTVDEADLIQTLEATTSEQIITLNPAKSGTYLLVKGEVRSEDDRHIHLLKLEVYGATPPTPVVISSNDSLLIEGTSTLGTVISQVEALDYQEDTLSYNIVDDVPFTINSQGHVVINGTLSNASYVFDVQVSDGINTATTTLTINVTSANAIEEALALGSVLKVTGQELLQASRDEIKNLLTGDVLLKQLYENETIIYDPSNRSQIINIKGDAHKIFPILQGNKGKTLAVAGIKSNSRFAAFGAAPMEHFQDGNNLSYEAQFKRLLSWLISNDVDDALDNKTIGLSFTYSDKADIKAWIGSTYPNWTIQECDRNNPDFSTCYNNVDLIITGWQTNEANTAIVRTRLESEVLRGTPILYLHTWYEAYNSVAHSIAELFEFMLPYAGNYWAKDKVSWDNVEAMRSKIVDSLGYVKIDTMLVHFQDNDYNFDWSRCKDGDGYGENKDDCSEVVGLSSEFENGAKNVQKMISDLDKRKKKAFDIHDYRLQKLLALLGDKFRQDVSYPMDKVTTDDNVFMRSYYADHAVYNFRTLNPEQNDMGNFSRSNFSHITPITKTVNLTSKKSFRSVGLYALPGQTVKVTRNDSSDLTVKVFINTLRSGATHQYQRNGYKRPKYLQTPHFEIKSGESIELTSPYGGTLQLEFSKNDLAVEVNFENVGEHAYWASSADNASFSEKLNDNEYDWAEIATAGFEVHSKLNKMIQSVNDVKWGSAEALAQGVYKYTSNYPHVLAGFKGDGVDVVDEIHDWANAKGLTIETIDIMKHMNADQAACGYGCSGNPYDAYWAFDPIGHGDIHEMGHSMQKMRFEGFPNHAATNTFSYYTKARYFANTSGEPDCQGLPFKPLFETIQSSFGESNLESYLKTNLWDTAGLGKQYLLKIQAMMHAQKLGKLENGWHVLARVHILEREMRRAKQDWEGRKASVGFSTYSIDEINSIRNNDWLMVAYSYASELDLRNYFTMMGMPHSDKAYTQIESFGFDVAPNSLFVSTSEGYCKTDDYGTIFDRPTLSIDGNSIYSY